MLVGIIGAGIGGLTAAIALQQKGIAVKVFERAKQIEAVGAGLTIAPNAMEVFRKLGLVEALQSAGITWNSFVITDEKLNVLQNIPSTFYRSKETLGVSIGRYDLHHLLSHQLSNNIIHLNHELDKFYNHGDQIELIFKNQPHQKVDILIGADGIHSTVRTALFPDSEILSAHQYCWRGLYPTQITNENRAIEAWGNGSRFGKTLIGGQKEYWYVVTNGDYLPQEWNHDTIIQKIAEFHPSTHERIRQTPLEKILLHPIIELKPLKSWYKGRVVLLGDAAHGMTPNMGQGAGQAIIDADVLAEVIAKGESFKEYQKERQTIVNRIVWMSRVLGKVGQWENSWMIYIRNGVMKITDPLMSRFKV